LTEASALEHLREDIRKRTESDKILSPAWVFLPLLAIGIGIAVAIVAVIVAFIGLAVIGFEPGVEFAPEEFFVPSSSFFAPAVGAGFGVAAFAGLVSTILLAYLGYMLISRRNKHFKRQSRFFEDMIAYMRALSSRKKVDAEEGLSSLERMVSEMRADQTEKSAILWVLLIINFPLIPLLYVLYFLGKDLRLHERMEDGLIEDSNKILESLGASVGVRRLNPIPERSFVLYLILTVVTLGIFGIYWLYILITDPNNHFKHHIQYEDELMSKISALT